MNDLQLKVGNVQINLNYYSGKDEYSDGDIEEQILRIVKGGQDLERTCYETTSFPIYYHLSRERELIIEPMGIKKTEEVLEIGSGCGAITGILSQKARHVDCVELSKRRSLINAYRHKNCNNITIYVGNYEAVQFQKKYDVITLIGVFEYANGYIHSNTPYLDFLIDIREKLKGEGRVYIAIENRLGAKYFSGCLEDHEGRPFVGIEGYNNCERARTFSYYEWKDLIQKVGFSQSKFYYPYPDYKFPNQIFTDAYIPKKGEHLERCSNYYMPRIQVFDEVCFLHSLTSKEEYRIFANSFLICLKK